MSIILFLLGRPGSGKSKVARHIKKEIPTAVRTGDYQYLLRWFRQEKEQNCFRQFEPSSHKGFKIVALKEVLPEALRQVNLEVLNLMKQASQEVILIEFARDTYTKELWDLFDRTLL